MKITFENSPSETIAFLNTIDNFVNAMAENERDSRRGRVVENFINNIMRLVGKIDLSDPKTKEAASAAINEVIGKFYNPQNDETEDEDQDDDTSEEEDYEDTHEDEDQPDDQEDEPNPWDNINEYYKIGDVVTGKVVKITCFGAFIELAHRIEGLVHISQCSKNPGPVEDIHDVLSVGDKITAIVTYINTDEHRIGLSIKQCPDQPEYPSNGTNEDDEKWEWDDVSNWAESCTVIPLACTFEQLCDALGGFPADKFPEELKTNTIQALTRSIYLRFKSL